ncbi:MAG: Na(+)/H(+) antiporter subunit D [Verrucomicrobia bacterium]|jgi:multicomponent Na+:H+ antiporter subunit D|nr:Na(+)/H(+) antiporter subunit D [Verrucomicrobiota bacterium]
MSAIVDLPPALWLVLTAAVLSVVKGRAGGIVAVAAPLAALGLLLWPGADRHLALEVGGLDLILFQTGPVNLLFGIIFLLISSIGALYAFHVQDRGQRTMAMLYAAGALGVTFAGDLFTLLVFWEVMAVSSSWLVFARKEAASLRAGFRYLMVHLAGGSVLMAGILLHYHATGSLALTRFTPGDGLAAWLILIGVCLNAALPPLHAWLPDAYPRATVTGAVFMSALTTKSAVYVLMVLFPGWQLLVYMGVLMTLYGVVYAVLANDIRRILAYHIISQVGYMVTGVGIGTELSLDGTAAHAYSHILYKALLFMGAGAVIQATGASKLSELGGLSRKMRPVLWLFMIGAFSISGFPLFNGFISKSMVVSAAGDAHYPVVMLGLFLASVGTFLSIGLKIPLFAFGGKEARLEVARLPGNMYLAMGTVAGLCILYGIAPGLLYSILPYKSSYHPYTAYHLVESIQLLTFTFIGFWILRGKLAGKPYIALDTDWFYRRGAPVADRLLVGPVFGLFEAAARMRTACAKRVAAAFANPYRWFRMNRGPADIFSPDRERPSFSTSVLWLVLVFIGLAAFAFIR